MHGSDIKLFKIYSFLKNVTKRAVNKWIDETHIQLKIV